MAAGTGKSAEIHVVDENAFTRHGIRASKVVCYACLALDAKLSDTGELHPRRCRYCN